MNLTAHERVKLDDFDLAYRQGQLPVARAVERAVCGCDYGGTSWATRDEADRIAKMLELRSGVMLLEIGAGSGWPALYLAGQTGCDTVLTDLPLSGMRIAAERAWRDGLSERCLTIVADGARLPFQCAGFDAINHSDVQCCLVQKREVLAECRRVIRPSGRMAFSVIYIPEDLPPADHARAAETAPDFVETDLPYPELLAATGWELRERHDLTAAFAAGCTEKNRAEAAQRAEMEALVGAAELDRRHARIRRRIAALEKGHLRRELFLAAPV